MHSYLHCVLIKLQTIFRFYLSCLHFCDVFPLQSFLAIPLHWLTFLTGYILFPTSPFLSHPIPAHLKVSAQSHQDEDHASCSLGSWALGQASFSALFELGGESVPNHPEQLPAATHSPFMPPPSYFAAAARALIPPFFLPPQAFRATAVWSGHGPLSLRATGNQHEKTLVERSDFPSHSFSTNRELCPVHLRAQWTHQGCWGAGKAHPPKSIYSHFPFISPSHQPLQKCWPNYCSFNCIVNYKSTSLGLSVRYHKTFGCPWCMISCRQATCYGLQQS